MGSPMMPPETCANWAAPKSLLELLGHFCLQVPLLGLCCPDFVCHFQPCSAH